MACSVTPDEYMSRLLMAKSCTMAKMRKTTTNQAGMALWWAKGRRPPAPVPMLSDERPDHGAQGHDEDLGHGRAEEDPADDALLRGVGRAVAGVVVAALGPAEAAQGDGEGQAGQVESASRRRGARRSGGRAGWRSRAGWRRARRRGR